MRLLLITILLCLAGSIRTYAQCAMCCDGILNGSETAIDCGGPDCEPCANLVVNGGFECHSGAFDCFIANIGNIDLAPPWTWVDATEKPDLFNSCHTTANVQVPGNYLGTQAANTGCAYVGLMVHQDMTSDPRCGYIQQPLGSTMTAGSTYDVSYYISRADNHTIAVPSISAYFGTGTVSPGDYAPLASHGYVAQINYNAQPASPPTGFITDATNWTQVTGTYTAAGGEDNIVIGNFHTRVNPAIGNPPNEWTFQTGFGSTGFYYIDDVTVIQTSALPVELVAFSAEERGTFVNLSWTTATELDNDYFTVYHSSDGVQFEPLLIRQGSVNSSSTLVYEDVDTDPVHGWNYYRLEQTDLDGTTKDLGTITAYVDGESGILIYPNPNIEDFVSFDFGGLVEDATVQILDVTGKKVLEQQFSGRVLTMDERLEPGAYLVRFLIGSRVSTHAFVQR